VAIVGFCVWVLLGLSEIGRHPEPWVTRYEVRASPIFNDNDKVLIFITNVSTAGGGAFPTENLKVFATNENGENVLVQMWWPAHYFWTKTTAVGMYTYGKSPWEKEIEVSVYLDNSLAMSPWRIRILPLRVKIE